MFKIQDLHAREILDSRGNPTIEVEISFGNPAWRIVSSGRAIVPSWASTGIHEALELRDGDAKRYAGKGVLKAVNNVNTTIKKTILNKEFKSVRELDQFLISLDGTKNKSNFGANAILGVSMAFVAAAAQKKKQGIYEYLGKWKGNVLPIPMMNIINGGMHADTNLDIQEFMIVPVGAANIHEAVRMWAEIFHTLKKILKSKWLNTGVGDEWWYAPNLSSNEEALQVIMQAIQEAGYTTDQIKLAMDVAASSFFNEGKYELKGESKSLTASELIDLYAMRMQKYPIISIEDGIAEDDFEGRKMLTKKLWKKIMLVGDDLFVTNMERLQMGIDQKMANAILIKLNQIWSVSETLDCIKMAQRRKMKVIISHRSGETEDTFIADLAVACNTWFIKTGSLSRTDRVAKYNQLMRIEEKLWTQAKYGN